MIGSRSTVTVAAMAFMLFQAGNDHRSHFLLMASPRAVAAMSTPMPDAQGSQSDSRQGGKFSVWYDGVELREFIQTVGPMLGFSPIRIDPEVQGKVTIEAAKGISKEAVLRIFDGVLNKNHAVLRKSGGVYRVARLEVPATASGGESATPKPPQREPVRVAGNIQSSRLIRRVEPAYPDLALRARVEATSLLEVTVNEQGDVAYVRIIRSGHPLLQLAAVDAVRQWRYLPTCMNGEAAPVISTVSVPFKLPGPSPGGAPVKVEPAATEGPPPAPLRVMREQQASRLAYLVEPDYAVTDAVKQWRYVPAEMNGSAIPVVAVVYLSFDLRNR